MRISSYYGELRLYTALIQHDREFERLANEVTWN
jgi:hypothetical protein